MPEGNLFARNDHEGEPLAARMRPRFLDEFVGQEHIIGPGKLLRRAIQADMLSSLIFYGPPGTGKTTLARVIANTTKSDFISLNAVLAGVKDVRESIDQARSNLELHDRRTILFVDEVHRWNKAQQDALLPWVENGTVVLIGATTHNPFFEVNSALVSRSRIFQLKPLTEDDMREIARRALSDPVRGYGALEVSIDDDALDHLIQVADGDARGLLGALQLAVETSVESYPPPPGTRIEIDRGIAEDSIQQKAVLYDKEGDYHFDVISAFIKSIRGSDPDAALYWMAKMVHSGEDPRYIFRRMLIAASEDIGIADPHALVVVEAAASAFERIGMPEGRFHLAHAALYLATAPKSNSALGFFDALSAVEFEKDPEVPNHLRDANRDKEGFGHGEGYLYPHAYSDHWVAQDYLPSSLRGRIFYQPSDQGYENEVRQRVFNSRALQLEAAFREPPEEVLTYSPSQDRELDRWLARTANGRTAALATLRDAVASAAGVSRHHSVYVGGALASLVLWQLIRAAPEGLVVAHLHEPRRLEVTRHLIGQLSPLQQPVVIDGSSIDLETIAEWPGADRAAAGTATAGPATADSQADTLAGVRYDRIVLVDPARNVEDWKTFLGVLERLGTASTPTRLVIAQRIPRLGQRLAHLLDIDDPELIAAVAQAEEALHTRAHGRVTGLSEGAITEAADGTGWNWIGSDQVVVEETRRISAAQLLEWFSPDSGNGLGAELEKSAGTAARQSILEHATGQLAGQEVRWSICFLLLSANLESAEP